MFWKIDSKLEKGIDLRAGQKTKRGEGVDDELDNSSNSSNSNNNSSNKEYRRVEAEKNVVHMSGRTNEESVFIARNVSVENWLFYVSVCSRSYLVVVVVVVDAVSFLYLLTFLMKKNNKKLLTFWTDRKGLNMKKFLCRLKKWFIDVFSL